VGCLFLFRYDQVFHFVVNGLGQNLFLHEFVLSFVGPATDDLRRVGDPNTGDRVS
jgi:hypothetical protein